MSISKLNKWSVNCISLTNKIECLCMNFLIDSYLYILYSSKFPLLLKHKNINLNLMFNIILAINSSKKYVILK